MAKMSKPKKKAHKGLSLPKELQEALTPEEQKAYIAEMKRRFGADPEDLEDPEDVADYLELAGRAATDRERLKWVRKARAVDPDDIDAALQETLLTSKGLHESLKKLKALLEVSTRQMEEKGYFEPDCIGSFWGLVETRPYMRLRYTYLECLMEAQQIRPAIEECKALLRLSENDNMGVRDLLIAIYAYLQEEAPAEALLERYGSQSSIFLFCMALLKYTLGKEKEAAVFLRRLAKINPDTKAFLNAMKDCEKVGFSGTGYRLNTMEELLAMMENAPFLYLSVQMFATWAFPKLRSQAIGRGSVKGRRRM